MENKVIIIGGDHHNALGLARMFGVNGIYPYGILTNPISTNKSNNFCYLSKYWKKTWYVEDVSKAFQLLLSEFSNEERPPVLFPTSDGAEYFLDIHGEQLQDKFILPGLMSYNADSQCFKYEWGGVASLMDKQKQVDWAISAGINTAKTWTINLKEYDDVILKQVPVPCIFKPVVSSEGNKLDILRCLSEDDKVRAIEFYRQNNYQRILVQEYIIKDYEAELIGCIPFHSKDIPYILTRNIREWPPVGGTGSYHDFIFDDKLNSQAIDILEKIRNTGYVGNVDVELFVVGDKLILNEVNFRNSGDVYYCFSNKLYYAYYLYLDLLLQDTSQLNIRCYRNSNPMNEITDLRHVVYGSLPLREWMKSRNNCYDFSLWFKGDLRPALRKYRQCLFKMFSQAGEQKRKANL